jgi:hypothetical protein
VDFDQSVELTFSISPKLRKVQAVNYCAGSPQNTPHYLAQLRVPPEEGIQFEINLDESGYILRSLQAKSRWRIQVKSDGKTNASLDFSEEECTERQITLAPGKVQIELINPFKWEIFVILETAEWLKDVCNPSNPLYLRAYKDFLV